MPQQTAHKRFGQAEYDPSTGRWLVALVVLAAFVLGALALSHQGSPRMHDKGQVEQGATIPNPTELSPAQTKVQ